MKFQSGSKSNDHKATPFYIFSNILKESLTKTPNNGLVSFNSPFSCAIAHATQDMCVTAIKHGFSEEDRTASFIGHLSTHLGWYTFLSEISKKKDEQTSRTTVSWSYQRKSDEAQKGGDFGIVLALDDDTYNVAFFQAKNGSVNADNATLDVTRHSGNYVKWRKARNGARDKIEKIGTASTTEEKKELVSLSEQRDACEQKMKRIDDELVALKNNNEIPPENVNESHQIVKLAHVNQKAARKITEATWIHYVIWPDESEYTPICINLKVIVETLKIKNDGCTEPVAIAANSSGVSKFAELLEKGLNTKADDWLNLSLEQIKNLVGPLSSLCPTWMIVDESGGSRGQTLVNALQRPDNQVQAKSGEEVDGTFTENVHTLRNEFATELVNAIDMTKKRTKDLSRC